MTQESMNENRIQNISTYICVYFSIYWIRIQQRLKEGFQIGGDETGW